MCTSKAHPPKWTFLFKVPFSSFYQMAIFFFPLICGIQAIFTVGGNKSLTVSNYLKNKTTHTKQNKNLCCQLLRDSEATTSGNKDFLPNYHKPAYLESICVSVQCFSYMIAASWDHPHITESGVAVWWGGEHPGFANIQRPSLQIPALTNFLSETKDKVFF